MVKRTRKGTRPTRRKTGKPRARKTKPGVSLKVKRDPQLEKRMAALGLDPRAFNEELLQVLFDLKKRPITAAARMMMYAQALAAFRKAAFGSDDPSTWIAAARRAAGL